MNSLKVIHLLLIFSLSIMVYSQGRVDGFYKGKGNLELGLGGGVEVSNNYFAGTTKISLGRTISNANLFAAYGIAKGFDVYLSIPYVIINNVRSVQDGSIYFKKKFLIMDFGSTSLSVSLAAGYSGNLAQYQTEGLSAIGQEAKVIDIRPILHFKNNNGWFSTLQYGYLYKFDPVPPANNLTIKAGYAAASYYFDFWYDFQNTEGGRDYLGTPAPTTFRELGVSYHKIGATFYKPFGSKFGGYAGVSSVITGRNISQGIGVNIGVILKASN
jgi:hypothetical protein